MNNKIFLDTSALMRSISTLEILIEEKNTLVICSIVLEELDNLKTNKDENKAFKSRQAIKFIDKHQDNIEFLLNDNIVSSVEYLPGFDMSKNDNKILSWCYNYKSNNENVKFLTYDICLKLKAQFINIECLSIDRENENDEYKGYIEIKGTAEENDYKLLELSSVLYPNQYVIIEDTDTDECQAVKWKNGSYHDVFYSKVIKPRNLAQSCAIDLMYDRDIPIKIICGTYGSGKTMIAVKSAEDLVNRYFYSKLMLVRNPIPVDNIDIGALPGTKHDKVGDYFKSMTQYLSAAQSKDSEADPFDPDNLEAAKKRGYDLTLEIPSFMKGISVDDTLMIVDECEDLNIKLIKMLGTRIGQNSSIVFTGDWHQAEQQYKYDSGISKLIKQTIDDPLVGIVVLDEDVRSSVSKIFARLK